MENFQDKLVDAIQHKIISDISKQDMVTVLYSDRIALPQSVLREIYESLNMENIKKRIRENLENEMADKITNKMVTEFATDIKKIMANRELREDLRHYAREKIRSFADTCTSVGE